MIYVSVVIPTYNRMALTLKAIDSVETKSPELVEIIVVDDAGEDVFVFPNQKNKHGVQVRVMRMSVNSGAGLARKRGVESALGKYIAFLDSDDEYVEGWIDCLIFHRNFNKNIFFVGRAVGGNKSAEIVRRFMEFWPQKFRKKLAMGISCFFNPFYTPSIAVAKEKLLFHESLRYCEDYYANGAAIFCVDDVVLLDILACKLGRPPNSAGGASFLQKNMSRGEGLARFHLMLRFSSAGFYPLFIMGFLYQFFRNSIKSIKRLKSRFFSF